MKLLITILVVLLIPTAIFAESKEIIAEGTYNMGDGETPAVAESRALLKAKQAALEQAGTYVESYSKVKNIALTHDEIQVLASGLMEVETLDRKRTIIGDGINFWIKIKAKVKPDEMASMAKRIKEKSVVADYMQIQEAFARSQKETEELKRQLLAATDEKKKESLLKKIGDEERLLQANEWHGKGYSFDLKEEFDNAIEAYTSAITLNPSLSKSFNNRGCVYLHRGQIEKAIKDFDAAISLDSNDAEYYYNRGLAHGNKNQHDQAINDFDKTIAININHAKAYKNRGVAYFLKGINNNAAKDFQIACKLGDADGCEYMQSAGALNKHE